MKHRKMLMIATVVIVTILVMASMLFIFVQPKTPTAPQAIMVNPSNASISLTWQAPLDNGGSSIIGYKLYRSMSLGGAYSLIASSSGLAYSDTNLTNGKSYAYYVRALNAAGEGLQSANVSATPFTVPDAPIGLNGISGYGQVSMNWTAPAFDGGRAIDYYVIYENGFALLSHPTGLTAIVTSLAGGQDFSFNITAHNIAGEGPQSLGVSAVPYTTPGVPTGLIALAENAQASLSWKAPSSNGGMGIIGYNVYRAIGSGALTFLTTVTKTSYLDIGLINGQAYSYEVSALNAIGEGPRTASVTTTPSADNDLLNAIESSGQLIVGTEISYAPFEYQLADGTYAGIDMEIAHKIADALNATLVIKLMDFDPLFGAVQTGEIDMAISSISITAAREQTVNFTVPYYTANQAVLVRDSSSISNIDDLNGSKVIAQLGTTGSSWVATNLIYAGRISAADFSDYVNISAAALTVMNGQKDALVVDIPVANAYAADPANHLKVAFVVHTNENYGVCIPKNQTNFRSAIDNVINEMKADGSLYAILFKYNAIISSTPSVPNNLTIIPGIGIFSVSWKAPTSNGGYPITGYNLYRSATMNGTYSLVASLSGLRYNDTNLTNGQVYWYKLTAFNIMGEGNMTGPGREQAQNTGDQAINNVAYGFVVQDVTGTVNPGNTSITDLTIQMRLQAGNPNINMDQVSIQFVSGSVNKMLSFANGSASATSGTFYGAEHTGSTQWASSNHVVHQGDMVTVHITGLSLGYSAAATVKIIPANGSSTLISFVTPSYYGSTYVNLK